MKYIRAIIKMLLFFPTSILMYVVWAIGNVFIPNKTYWRQIAFRTWSRWFVKLSGMTIDVLGEKPNPPFFLVSNHLSYTDIPVLRSVIESVFVAKKDIESWFLAGTMVRVMGNIFIDRGNRRDIPAAGEKIIEKLEHGEGVIVFPEGTSTKGEEVLPFNSSFFEFAAKSDLPIHYASISYQTSDQNNPASNSICWWDEKSFIEHLWQFFQLRECRAIISFGCESVVKPNRKELAKELWARVNDKFIPVV